MKLIRRSFCFHQNLNYSFGQFKLAGQNDVVLYIDREQSCGRNTIEDQIKQTLFCEEAQMLMLANIFAFNLPIKTIRSLELGSINFFKQMTKIPLRRLISINTSLMGMLNNNNTGHDFRMDTLQNYFECQKIILEREGGSNIEQLCEYLSSVPWNLIPATLDKKSLHDCVDDLFMVIEEKITTVMIANIDDFQAIENFDPIHHALKQQSSSKWKLEEHNKFEIIQQSISCSYLIELVWMFQKLHQGSSLFYYSCFKYLEQNVESSEDSMEFLYMLAYFDKTSMIDVGKLKCKPQPHQLNKSLFYSLMSFDDALIADTIQRMKPMQWDDHDHVTSMVINSELLKLDHNIHDEFHISANMKASFNTIQMSLYSKPFLEDIGKYLDNNHYIHERAGNINMWTLPFLFAHDQSILLPLSSDFYLGRTIHQVFWAQLYKRVLRTYNYKIRILDVHEYTKLETRHEKDKYLEGKLRGLQRQQRPEKKPHFNY